MENNSLLDGTEARLQELNIDSLETFPDAQVGVIRRLKILVHHQMLHGLLHPYLHHHYHNYHYQYHYHPYSLLKSQ